jgi:tetratricopeptide (TPR) repeat protein
MRQAMRLLRATSICGWFFVASSAAAAPPTPDGKPNGDAAAPAVTATTASPGLIDEARKHYEQGLVYFHEGHYDAALGEFERAHELAPSYRILYNLGRIHREQRNYAAAMRSYARYLREGGSNIPPERRAEIDQELAVLKPRVAEITVTVNVDGANVYADDIPVCAATIESSCVGVSPLRDPIMVNGGRHRITATKKGYVPQTALVSVVGSDTTEVRLELPSIEVKIPKGNPWTVPTIVAWSATGLSLIGATVMGALALDAQDDQATLRNSLGATRHALDEARDKTTTLAGVSDALFVTAGVFSVVSAYFTIKMIGASRKEVDPRRPSTASLDFRMSPTSAAAVGTF